MNTEEKIKNQQELADKLIKKLEIVDPACILAGGGPRNWFMGKEANDLDFYVHLDEVEWMTALRWERLGLDLKLVDFNSTAWKDYGIMVHLFRIYEMEYEGQKVQVMCMKASTFNSVVDHFGVSICKFWWKSIKQGVIPHDHALTSIINKTLYVKDDYSAKEIHVDKMRKYFPEYDVKPMSEVGLATSALRDKYNHKRTDCVTGGVTYNYWYSTSLAKAAKGML